MANSVFTDEQINEILSIFRQNLGHRQYIGARYVPIFGRKGEESIEWDNSAPYEPLTIVLHQGNSFTSRQYVPTGIDIDNTEFWAETGNYNAQVEQYRQEVLAYKNELDNVYAFNNPIKYGADPTGSDFSDAAFKGCIEANYGKTINVTPGVYRFKEPLEIPAIPANRVNIDFGGSILDFRTDGSGPCIIVGNDLDQNYNANQRQCIISNFVLTDLRVNNGIGTGILFRDWSKTFRFNNFAIIGEFKTGIQIGNNQTLQYPGDIYLDNFSINLGNSAFENTGIAVYNTDCKFNNGIISGIRYAFESNSNAIFVDNVHALAQGNQLEAIESAYLKLTGRTYTDTTTHTYNGNHWYLTNCYADTMKHFISVDGSYVLTMALINCKFYSYLDMQQIVFDMPDIVDWNFTIIGGQITLSSLTGNRITNATTNANSEYNVNNRSIVEGLTFLSGNVDTLADPFICTKNRIHPYTSNLSLEADTWYKIAIIGNCRYQQIPIRISLGGTRYWEGFLAVNSSYTNATIVKTGGSANGQVVSVGVTPIEDGFELYAKSQDGTTSLVSVSSANNSLYPLQLTGRILNTLQAGTPTITE